MGVQRHLKVLGIFARLNYRDGKPQYLDDLPLVLEYLLETCANYTALAPLNDLLLELGVAAISERVLALTDRLVEGLRARNAELHSPREPGSASTSSLSAFSQCWS